MNKKVEKKPTLTQRMDSMEAAREGDSKRLDKILELMLSKGEPVEEGPKKKEPERDAEGNIIKYFMFVSPNPELIQMTEKRSCRKMMGQYGDYTVEPPEICSFGRDTEGPPGFFRTPDEDVAQRLRNVLKMLTAEKRPHVFTEVTDDPAFTEY
jgi:hypothetical protein